MAAQYTHFILRILSGINNGATVRLKTGSIVIGNAMTSDIILHDENIADQHVLLLVTPANITLQPLAQPVFVNGQEVTTESLDLLPQQTVQLGSVEFVVSDINQRETKVRRSNSSGATKRRNPGGRKASHGQPATSLAVGRNVANEQHKKTASKKPWSNKVFLGIGLALLLLANLVFFFPQLSWLMQRAGLSESEEDRAVALLHELGQRDFQLQETEGGGMKVYGYTQTVEQRNALISQVREADLRASLDIWAEDEMLENANMIVQALGETDVKLAYGDKQGELVAQGFVSDKAVWKRTQETIFGDVGGVRSIDDTGLRSLQEYMTSFMQFIDKKGLSGQPEFMLNDGQVIVSGEFTQTEIDKLESLKKQFVKLYSGGPNIILKTTNVRDRIELAIRSVSVGDVPFLVAQDGKKYMEGSVLGEDYFVKSIQSDHIVLTKNGATIPFYYGIEEDNDDAAN